MGTQPSRRLDAVLDSVRAALRHFIDDYLRSCGEVFRRTSGLGRFADIFHRCQVPQRYLHVLANLYSTSRIGKADPDGYRYAAPRALRASLSSLALKKHRNLVRDMLDRFDRYGVTRTTEKRLRFLTPEGVSLAEAVILPWFEVLEHLRASSGIKDWRTTGRLLWKLRGSQSPEPADRPRIDSLDQRTPTIPAEHFADLEEALELIRRPSSDAEIMILTLLLPNVDSGRLEAAEQECLAADLERMRIGLTAASARDILGAEAEIAKRATIRLQHLAGV